MTVVQKQTLLRPELGDFSSIVFLKDIIIGIEDAIGDKTAAIAMISTGRKQGKALAQERNLANKATAVSLEEVREILNQILGKDGTRLCIVDKIEQSGEVYKVYSKETFCSAGEPDGSSRKCTYTLGAIQGFLEVVLGKRLQGKQTDSILRGGSHDLLEYSVIN
jgi:predicted hydrocarbon binding protein